MEKNRESTSVLLIAEESEEISRILTSLAEYHPGTSTEFTHVGTLREGLTLLANYRFDLVMADLSLADARGLEVFATIYAQVPDLPIVVLVDSDDEVTGLKAVQHGAEDYILKDQVHGGLVARTAQHAIQYRATEEALARERERLTVTLRSIGEGLITTDTDGRVSLVNRMAEELTGWRQEQGRGLPLDQILRILDEESETPLATPLDDLLAGTTITEFGTALLEDRKGRRRLIEMTGAPLRDREGTITGAVLAFRDVTAQRRLQEERLRADKLEAIGKLAGGIAHDFNNLLVGILGNLSLIRDTIGETERADLVEAAETSTLRARDLARQLLTFSSGGAPIRSKTRIEDLLSDTTRLTLSGSNLGVDLTLDDDLWPVEVDESQFQQAIANLIDNARLAMPDGGNLRILCENVDGESADGEELHERGAAAGPVAGGPVAGGPLAGGPDERSGPTRFLRIMIEDEGIGIEPSLIPQIFDPYFTTRDDATGMGLAIAHSIISRHNGRIEVRSRPGKGTIVEILMPALDEGGDRVEGGALQETHLEGSELEGSESGAHPEDQVRRILLMDDDEMVRRVAARMVQVIGYEIDTAEDGEEAVRLHQEALEAGRPYELIIMDLTVPGGVGGREAMQRIRIVDQTTRSIVSSGYFNDPIMANYREHGFDGVIAKPYQLDTLRDAIHLVLSEPRVVPAKP